MRSTRQFWMILTVLLALTISFLCWSMGKQATLDLEYQYYINGLYHANEHYYIKAYERETYRLWLEAENEELKQELASKGRRPNKKPF